MPLNTEQKGFLKSFYHSVSEICPKYGLFAIGAITAQAISESNWGRSVLSKKYYNYFGMKCGSSWKGSSVTMNTKEEYIQGTITSIRDKFRSYKSSDDGIRGYCEFICGLSRYKNLIGITDDLTYIRTLKADKWATDSKYVSTLTNILKTYVIPICTSSGKQEAVDPGKKEFYPKYDGYSISLVVALTVVGVDSSMENRKKIAIANGINGYKGYASQNLKLLKLLKNGSLVKP